MNLVELCRSLGGNLAAARAALADGAAVDLTGLDADVGTLCRAAEQAAPGDRPALTGALAALAGELDALAAALQHRHSAAVEPADAARAYARPGRAE